MGIAALYWATSFLAPCRIVLQGLMDIRPYLAEDRAACLGVFDSISPAPPSSDRTRFEMFLGNPDGPFFVLQHENAVIGCGGYTVAPGQQSAHLVWGLIRSDSQRQGLGRFLLMYRLREIGKLAGIERVLVETPRAVARFFEGQGFKIVNVDGDRFELVKRLTVCA
jgi:hypothetical protein